MKKNNVLKIITIIMTIILLSLISFVGIYTKKLNKYENILPKFKTSMDFGERREVRLKVDESTETVYYDAEGKVVEHTHAEGEEHSDDETLEEGITKKEEPINSPEILTQENYNLSKDIILKRLKEVQAPEYNVKSGDNGLVLVELPDDISTDTYIELISSKGLFQMLDSQTQEVLMDNRDIKTCDALYNTTEEGTTIYLNIEFKKESRSKLEEISKNYIETTDEEGNTTTKNVTLKVDNQTLANTYFGTTMSDGILQMPMSNALTSQEEIIEHLTEANLIATLIKNGNLPIQYEIDYNNTISSEVTQNDINVMIVISVVVVGLMIIYLIIRNHVNGITMGISLIGFIATLLLLVRLTNCVISVNAILAIIVMIVFNYIFILEYLKNIRKNKQEETNSTFKNTFFKYLKLGTPLYVVGIVFTFSKLVNISSFGMPLFWGAVTFLVYNFLVVKHLTVEEKNK